MDILDRKGNPITDWRNWTRPKKEDGHWRASRSAMEMARAWFTSPVPVVPPEIETLLQSQSLTRDLILQKGWPELKTPLPFPGEGRNHDLVMLGESDGRQMLLAIEGKVDESMGPPIGTYWRQSKRTPRSRAWRRIDSLLLSIFGPNAIATEKPWSLLPYQMLTATVGTVLEAKRQSCEVAILCVHELSRSPRSRGL